MLNTEGFTQEGLSRKAACKALCQKILYLAEHEPLVSKDSEAAELINLRTVRCASYAVYRRSGVYMRWGAHAWWSGRG